MSLRSTFIATSHQILTFDQHWWICVMPSSNYDASGSVLFPDETSRKHVSIQDWCRRNLGIRELTRLWSRQVIREFAAQSDVWLEGHACFTNAATDTLLVFWKSELNNTRQLLDWEISGGGLHTNQSEQNAPCLFCIKQAKATAIPFLLLLLFEACNAYK